MVGAAASGVEGTPTGETDAETDDGAAGPPTIFGTPADASVTGPWRSEGGSAS
jgi:hypothetical protein